MAPRQPHTRAMRWADEQRSERHTDSREQGRLSSTAPAHFLFLMVSWAQQVSSGPAATGYRKGGVRILFPFPLFVASR